MIRFIVELHVVDHNDDINRREYITIDGDVERLERLLRTKAEGPMGFDVHRLVGVELLPTRGET